MVRLLLLLCLFHAPLFAVSAGDKSPLELTELRVTIDLSTDGAAVTCKATLKNPGEVAHAAQLTLPRPAVPEEQRNGFTIKVAGISRESDSAETLQWQVAFESAQSVEVAWSYTLPAIDLPHTHPQGEREVRVALSHMQGFAAMPGTATCTVSSATVAAELFGGMATHDISIEDYEYRWLARTWQASVDALQEVRNAFGEAQRTHLNRSYTETLVHLADLYSLKERNGDLAEVCETLAALEAQGGKPITHCGPWAEWRRHVPWELRRLHALTQAGKDGKEAATAAKNRMAVIWPVYLAAREKAQPFEYFDRAKFRNYHDYDWNRTRELYAAALELLGDVAAAQAVRDTE